jgi:sugar/nucleoside kinase (ribokinase family)
VPDVTCVGGVVADIVGRPIDALPERGQLAFVERMELHSGGGAANVGMVLDRLSIRAAIIGKVGKDGFGDYLIQRFAYVGIDVSGMRRDPLNATAAAFVLTHSDGERSFLHYVGANGTLGLEDVDMEIVRRSKILHAGNMLILPSLDGSPLAELFRQAQAMGVLTSLDTAWDPTGAWMQKLAPCLPYTDYFLPSYEEAKRLAPGYDTPDDVAQCLLDAGAKVVALKMGAEGSYVRSQDGFRLRLPALPVPVVDTTGAGDAYIAGFLTGLVRKWDLEQCAHYAGAVGAACVTAIGTTAGIGGYVEIFDLLRRLGVMF